MSKAITASEPSSAGSVYPLPVATYTARRSRSTVGDDQTPAPAGAQSCVPFEVTLRRTGSRAIEYDFHSRRPVCASYAATPPRNVQHGYTGLPAPDSSSDESGTNSLPSASAGAPVTRATGCASRRAFQTTAPVSALSAYTLAR